MAEDDLDFGETLRGVSAGQKVFDRYVLKKILGRGGMGIVWLARDEKLERDIALKFLPEMLAMDPEALVDLKRETRRSLDLTHPRIVRIYDLVENARSAAIAMEYVEGSSLGQVKLDQAAGCFEVKEIERWVKQLCEALAYAHEEAKVVHRDLKPSNVMLDGNGNVKVADFGIAANISDSVSRVSKHAGSSGTPLYMSPQQMMGEDPTVTDDVYALGATLFELLVGKPPFHTGNVMMQVMNKPPPKLAERRVKVATEAGVELGEVPQVWVETIEACLAKDPVDRPQSIAEVWVRLDGLVPPVESPAAATQDQPADAVNNLPKQKPDVERSDHAESPRNKTGLWAGLALVVGVVAAAGWWFGMEQPRRELAADQLASQQVEARRIAEEVAATEAAEQAVALERIKAEAQQEAIEQLAADEAARLAALRIPVLVTSEPVGATLIIDGQEVGRTPWNSSAGLALGSYRGEMILDGYDRGEMTLAVTEQGVHSWSINLDRSMGTAEWAVIKSGDVSYRFYDEANGESDRAMTGVVGDAIPLPTGRYAGVLTHPAGERVRVAIEVPISFEVRSGETTAVEVDIRPAMLTFNCPDPTSVTFEIAGPSLGNQVLTGEVAGFSYLGLPAGEFEVRFQKNGWPDEVRTFQAELGDASKVDVEFPYATLAIVSEPSGAEVLADGQVVGTTPSEFNQMKPGPVSYTLQLEGYKLAEVSGVARAGDQLRLSATLEKFPGFEIPGLGITLLELNPGSYSFTHPETGANVTMPVRDSFWIGETEVTQGQWTAVMGSNPSDNRGSDQLPVDMVSWRDALRFCERLTKRERAAGRLPAGYVYNLPTDIQWEYACRAGDSDAVGNDDFWHQGNSDGSTHPVGTSTANAWGLYDTFGNAAELCLDYNKEELPWGYVGFFITKAASYRGGYADLESENCGPEYRMFNTLGRGVSQVGFRVALVPNN